VKPAGVLAGIGDNRASRILWWGFFPTSLVLLLWLSWLNRYQTTNDAIGYVRAAEYLAAGDWRLVVSGYWSPLVSWLMAPALAAGLPALVAMRLAAGVSAVVFWVGCVRVLQAFRLEGPPLLAGIWIAGLMGVAHGSRLFGADLLVAGCICLACSALLDERWATERRRAVIAGVLWGVAYHAKAVALPLAVLIVPGMGLCWWIGGRRPGRAVARAVGTTLAVCALVVLPWVVTLSLKYGKPTYATVPRIAHAIMGKRSIHPSFSTLHQPDPGRIASWEDPTFMPYQYWSPLESRGNFVHQLKIIRANVGRVLVAIRAFDRLDLGLLGCLAALVGSWRITGATPAPRRRWAVLPVLVIFGLTLPVYAGRLRYYYAVLPFLWLLAWDAWERLAGHLRLGTAWRRAALGVLSFSFLVPIAITLSLAVRKPGTQALQPQILAARLAKAGKGGPVAGQEGLWVAYFLKTPFYGQDLKATAEEYLASGARLVLAPRGKPLAAALGLHPQARDLDPVLFGSAAEASSFRQVFEVLPGPVAVPPRTGTPPPPGPDAGDAAPDAETP
jgi:hypothetical protein